MLKRCKRCGDEKPATLEYFSRHRDCVGGLNARCRACTNAVRQKWRSQNRDRLSAQRRFAYQNGYRDRHRALQDQRLAEVPERVAAERLRVGLRERGGRGLQVASEMTRPFIEAWLKRQPDCECCGVRFHLGRKNGKRQDSSPSLDRFDLSKGYTVENTALVCWRCNNIKRNYGAADLRMVADWIERRV